MNEYVPWMTLALLGAYHGLNPGMGWLFAVALGLQEGSRAAVLRAIGPIALGHAASVAVVVALVGAAHAWIDMESIRALGASALVMFGVYKLLAPLSHPRWVGMRVSGRDLAAWSFLMSTAHGAGLMLVPILMRLPCGAICHLGHTAHAAHAAHTGHVVMMSAAPGLPPAELAAIGALREGRPRHPAAGLVQPRPSLGRGADRSRAADLRLVSGLERRP